MQDRGQQTVWDKRTRLIGLVGSLVCAILAAFANYAPVEARINHGLSSVLLGWHAADWISAAGAIGGLLALPALLSAVSHRWYYLWGLMPAALTCVFIVIEDLLEKGWGELPLDCGIAFVLLLVSTLITSGPVSVFRYSRVRDQRRREAAQRTYEAMRQAAAVPQEGVWPPPPEYKP